MKYKRYSIIAFLILLFSFCFSIGSYCDLSELKETEIKVNWALFPRVYCTNSTAFIPVKFSVRTLAPKSFSLTPVILSDTDETIVLPDNTPEIKLSKNEESVFVFMPYNVGDKTGARRLKFALIDNNGIIYSHVEYPQEQVGVYVVNLWVIILLLLINAGIVTFYKIYAIKFLELKKRKKTRYACNAFMAIEILLFSYLFTAPWNISLAVTIVLIAFLCCNFKSKLYMPLVFGSQLILLESYMDLTYGVKPSAVMISMSAIIMVTTLLFLITYFYRKAGMIISLVLSILANIYYVAQLYYQSFFQEFFPVGSLGKAGVLGELSSSVMALTTNVELLFFVLVATNVVMFIAYRKYSDNEIKEEKKEKILMLMSAKEEGAQEEILEQKEVKKSTIKAALNLAGTKGFHRI